MKCSTPFLTSLMVLVKKNTTSLIITMFDDLKAKVEYTDLSVSSNNTCLVDSSYVVVQENGLTEEKLTRGLKSIVRPSYTSVSQIIDHLYLFEILYLNLKRITYPLIGAHNRHSVGNLRLIADVKDFFWKKVRNNLVRVHVETLLTEYSRIYLNMPLDPLKIFKKYPGLMWNRRWKHEPLFYWFGYTSRKWLNVEGIPVFVNRSRLKLKNDLWDLLCIYNENSRKLSYCLNSKLIINLCLLSLWGKLISINNLYHL